MHSIMVIGGGLLMLAAFVIAGRVMAGHHGMAKAARWFIPVWLLVALYNNMYAGIQAGYTVMQELPFFVLVFGLPALIAWALAQFFTKKASRA